MITYAFFAFLGLAMLIALSDWRRGWYLAIVVGILQDPVRKVTPGTPVVMIMCVVAVYLAMILGSTGLLRHANMEFRQRQRQLYGMTRLFILVLAFAAVNGLVTFGIEHWKVPAVAFFLYLIPMPAILFGYRFLRGEDDLLRFFAFYAVITAIAMVGVPLEYARFDSPILGAVALGQDWIRHFPGLQIRILSGFYRSPDIMAWHAAMLTITSLVLMFRRGFPRGWIWMAFASWGFFCCMLSGRRKMLYMVAVFAAIFLTRYLRRLSIGQIMTLAAAGLTLWFVVHRVSGGGDTSVYARGAVTSGDEIFKRLEGGAFSTIRQNGILGLGLGSATQGVQRFAAAGSTSWQEGGAGKLAVELGLPGFLYVLIFAFVIAKTMFHIALRMRGPPSMTAWALLSIFAANVASFMTSHQPFSDGGLVLINALLIGCLFSMPRLAEQESAQTVTPKVASKARPTIAAARA